MGPFAFVQFEFGFLLGPGDGRFLTRAAAGDDPEWVLVLATLGAPERRRLRGRRGRSVERAEPEPVPTTRATVIRPEPFADSAEAERWLSSLRSDEELADDELRSAVRVLGRALHAYRAAYADPGARDVSTDQALVMRIGYGAGEEVAEGRYEDAWELPRRGRRTRRSMEAPEERFAALLGARERVLACEELVLRARADLDAGRLREAALQARVALESLLAELAEQASGRGSGDLEAARRARELEDHREAVGEAANAALRGELPERLAEGLGEAVARMEGALRVRRLGSAS